MKSLDLDLVESIAMNSNNIETNVLEQTNIMHCKGVLTPDECAVIKEQILEYKNTQNIDSPDRQMLVNANQGCWMGQPHFHGGFTDDVESLIVDKIKAGCSLYYESLPKPKNITQEKHFVDKSDWELWAWANVNDPGSENREHTHTGYFLSGTIYFQSTDTGPIEFLPYQYVYKQTHVDWPYNGTAYYYPEDGDLLLFPSYLLHKIHKNPSNKQRVNIAFNATLATDNRILS